MKHALDHDCCPMIFDACVHVSKSLEEDFVVAGHVADDPRQPGNRQPCPIVGVTYHCYWLVPAVTVLQA
jgi:hypothetical protein